MRFRHLPLLALLAFALLAPSASASPAAAPTNATSAAKKAKKCKRRFGESRKHWLKRCKCKAFKKGETRKKFKKRCPGAKVPKRKQAPGGGGGSHPDPAPANPAPGAAPPATGPLTGQAAIDYVNAAVKGMRISRQSCSGTGCERSLTEFVDFCSDGASFNGRTTNDNSIGGVYESRLQRHLQGPRGAGERRADGSPGEGEPHGDAGVGERQPAPVRRPAHDPRGLQPGLHGRDRVHPRNRPVLSR
jgi:hypothetical protein